MPEDNEPEVDIDAAVSKVKRVAVGAVLVVLALSIVTGGLMYTVNDGERAVVTRFGEVQGTSTPGLHFKLPLVDSVHKYEVRTRAYTMSSSKDEGQNANRDDSIEALTAEGLNVNVDVTVRYHNDPGKVDYIYTNVGATQSSVRDRIVRPTTREAVRSCSAQYPVEGIYSDQRDDFGQCITDRISSDFTNKGIVLETVQVRNIMLPQKVRDAIQDKQATQQRIEQKENELEVEKLEKQRRVIEAEGIAESQAIIDETLTPEYLRYLWIQEGLEKGDAIYVPIGDDGLPLYKDVDSVRDGAGESNNSTIEFTYDDRTNATA